MALTPCKSCGNQVDANASACPHCGCASPGGMELVNAILGVVVLGGIGVIAIVINWISKLF